MPATKSMENEGNRSVWPKFASSREVSAARQRLIDGCSTIFLFIQVLYILEMLYMNENTDEYSMANRTIHSELTTIKLNTSLLMS